MGLLKQEEGFTFTMLGSFSFCWRDLIELDLSSLFASPPFFWCISAHFTLPSGARLSCQTAFQCVYSLTTFCLLD